MLSKHLICSAIILALTCFATAAFADPCKAIPDSGPKPSWLKPGVSFTGIVNYVGDGDGLCVAIGPKSTQWIEVRLEDFYAPELSEVGGKNAKKALQMVAMGKRVTCRYKSRSYDRAVATCYLNGVSLGRILKEAGVKEGGRGR
jgi:micrococcal nuclease